MEIPSFSDIWDSFTDEMSYIFTGEFFGDVGEFFSGMFENIGEFSVGGLVQGLVMGAATYYVINKLDFITQASLPSRMFYTILCLLVTFIYGYLSGKKIWDN